MQCTTKSSETPKTFQANPTAFSFLADHFQATKLLLPQDHTPFLDEAVVQGLQACRFTKALHVPKSGRVAGHSWDERLSLHTDAQELYDDGPGSMNGQVRKKTPMRPMRVLVRALVGFIYSIGFACKADMVLILFATRPFLRNGRFVDAMSSLIVDRTLTAIRRSRNSTRVCCRTALLKMGHTTEHSS